MYFVLPRIALALLLLVIRPDILGFGGPPLVRADGPHAASMACCPLGCTCGDRCGCELREGGESWPVPDPAPRPDTRPDERLATLAVRVLERTLDAPPASLEAPATARAASRRPPAVPVRARHCVWQT